MLLGENESMIVRNGLAWVVGVGAGRGTGAATARRFAREGLTVAVTGRSPDKLQTLVGEIEGAGGRGIALPGDMTEEADVLDILARLERIGPVEIGIYNAGNAIWGPPLETKTPDFEAVWRVGCLGGFMFGREVARSMLQRGRGYDSIHRSLGITAGKGGFCGLR
jgi:NAD(P)-dependent dehydrogenase (short-subunit alcohol dehydrogenase family)